MFVAQLFRSFSFCEQNQQYQKIFLIDLNQDILFMILSQLSSNQVAECRLVCHKFNKICKKLLNRRFSYHCTAVPNMLRNVLRQNSLLPSVKEKEKNLQMLSACLLLLRAVFGRYISIGHCCFYPGRILDDIDIIMKKISHKKRKLMAAEVAQEKKMFNKSLCRLVYHIKKAADHFEKRIEPFLPHPRTFVGTKILDLLLSNSEIQQDTMDSFYKKVAERFPRNEINGIGIRRLLQQARSDLICYNSKWIYNSSMGQIKNEATTSRVDSNCCKLTYENNMNYVNLSQSSSSEDIIVENNKMKHSDVRSLKTMNNCSSILDVNIGDTDQENFRNLMPLIPSNCNESSSGNFSPLKGKNETNRNFKANDSDNSDMAFNLTKKFDGTPVKSVHVKNAECNRDEMKGHQRKSVFDGNEDTIEQIILVVRKNGDKCCFNCNKNNDYPHSGSKITQLLNGVEKSLLNDTNKFIAEIKMKEPCFLSSCPSFDLLHFNGVNSSSTIENIQHPSTSSAADKCLEDTLEGKSREYIPTEVHKKVDAHSKKSKRLRDKYKDDSNIDKKVLRSHKKSKPECKSQPNGDCISETTQVLLNKFPKLQ